jgi:adenylate cyclase
LEIENGQLPYNRRMEFRIGINLGDILHKDDRIYGDGANLAAWIESLADLEGIFISRVFLLVVYSIFKVSKIEQLG